MDDSNTNQWTFDEDEVFEFHNKKFPTRASASMKTDMNEHLYSKTKQTKQHIKIDILPSIIANDKLHTEIAKISDILGDGISKMFTEPF